MGKKNKKSPKVSSCHSATMGKKNKKSSKVSRLINSTSCEDFMSLEDEIIQNMQLLRETGGLVIGLNAVLRGLKKKSFCVIILVSRKATSAMYHALNMLCKNTDVIFLQIKDIDLITSHSKILVSTAYGIKTSILTEQQKFGKLIEHINRVRNSQKFKKQRNLEIFPTANDNHALLNENFTSQVGSECYESETGNPVMDNICLSLDQCHKTESNSFIHASHVQPTKVSGSHYGFLRMETEFPNYNLRSNEVSFYIK